MARRRFYIGLMSGTSLDGVDAALARFEQHQADVLATFALPFEAELRASLLALNTPGADELHRAATAGNALARCYAAAVGGVLSRASTPAAEVAAIGCHGQTVRHRPDLGYSCQIGNAALLAELSGITVVSDFRSRDLAAGGQGAPLVPAFHAQLFASALEDRLVLNLGGIANITGLPARGEVFGFDCGPGNCLLDLWAARHLGRPFDLNGEWAGQGRADEALLQRLLQEPYFAAPHPKSTGRDLFNEAWLAQRLPGAVAAADVQATLLELTARGVFLAARECREVKRIIVCGGGAHNGVLLRRLAGLFAPATVETSAAHGVDPDFVEALAFAWLAKRTLQAQPGNLPAATGARGLRVLGAIYPG